MTTSFGRHSQTAQSLARRLSSPRGLTTIGITLHATVTVTTQRQTTMKSRGWESLDRNEAKFIQEL